MGNHLVTLRGKEILTNSIVIANGTNNKHNFITRIIQNYKEDFIKFGKIRFTDLKTKKTRISKPLEIYWLNERQAILLITYLGDTEITRKFKKELIRQFCDEGKLRRITEPEQKKDFDDKDEFLYINYTRLLSNIFGVSKRDKGYNKAVNKYYCGIK